MNIFKWFKNKLSDNSEESRVVVDSVWELKDPFDLKNLNPWFPARHKETKNITLRILEIKNGWARVIMEQHAFDGTSSEPLIDAMEIWVILYVYKRIG